MASFDLGKDQIIDWIQRKFDKGATCLDVGAGDGKWSGLLGNYLVMDACEIYLPNIWENNLERKYRNVYNADIYDLRYGYYDLIIFGDVIEHMGVRRAQAVIEYALPRCKDLIVAVPYLYAQGKLYGNEYERHVQDDLTPEIFAARYPQLKILLNRL